jgi:DNA invertase Pin-like site-specific DNA recombinase
MDQENRIPVATYLRVSTERQQYSLTNQSEAIEKYAERHGFSVVKTYSDAAKTGVIFRKRKALQMLIQDVVQGLASYRAILVYDVSRWGRFQDTDESAHYEFLCKSAGIPVHYCAESFSNDSGLSALMMKSLKRVMAGEYSRELGVKIFAAQKKLASLGYRQGGAPGYGLRRLLVTANGQVKQLLGAGERKSIANDRVIQVLGPPEEVGCVREIYRLFIQEKMTFQGSARELDRRQIIYPGRSEWDHRQIRTILVSPKYAGFNVYGRSSMRLYTPKLEVPRSEWTVLPEAFEALIEPSIFAEAQQLLATHTRNQSNADLLDGLRAILAKEGRLSMDLIKTTTGVPSPTTYRIRFGSIGRAYELIGHKCHFSREWLKDLHNIRLMRENLMKEIVAASGGCVAIENRGAKFRTRLRLRNRQLISVIASRYYVGYNRADRWRLKCVPDERRLITLVARLNEQSNGFKDFFVTPPIGTSKHIGLAENDARFIRAVRLDDLHDFVVTVQKIARRRGGWVHSEVIAKPGTKIFSQKRSSKLLRQLRKL